MVDRSPHRRVHLTHPEAHIPGYEMPEAAAPPATWGQLALGFAISVGVAIFGFWLCDSRYLSLDIVLATFIVTKLPGILIWLAIHRSRLRGSDVRRTGKRQHALRCKAQCRLSRV